MQRHILIALDGSPLAEQILPKVEALLAGQPARLILLRVVSRIPNHLIEFDKTSVAPREEIEANEREAHAYLERTAAPLRAAGHNVETVVMLEEHPAEAILDYLSAQPVDLLAIVTHGRSGLSRLIFGSVTEQLLRNANVPLLVLRPTEPS
jgi:nucleotide-binding universal stress UspA family protein